jgi:hypothetical protein
MKNYSGNHSFEAMRVLKVRLFYLFYSYFKVKLYEII